MKSLLPHPADSNVSLTAKPRGSKNLPGIIFVIIIAIIANIVGKAFPVIGGAVTAIVLGIAIKQFIDVPQIFSAGISLTLNKLLKAAIILLGFSFSFTELYKVGLNSIVIVLTAVISGILLTFFIGKLFKLQGNIPLLISLGTGICGATAIAATGPVIKAKEEEIVYAVNTIFAFNVLAVLIYPLIGHLLQMPDHQFGVWAGTAIHDTSSVIAAGYNYSTAAGDSSVIVKLIRTLMLIPVSIILSVIISMKSRKVNGSEEKLNISKVFPFFILFFTGAAALNTMFQLPGTFVDLTTDIAKFLIIMVMASVGLGTDFKKIKAVGMKPLMVGLISSIFMGGLSLLLVRMLF